MAVTDDIMSIVMDNPIVRKLDQFFSPFPAREFKKGDTIMHPNTNPPGIFYIEKGIVRRYALSENGSEITLNLYKPHTFLPMSWAISDIDNIHFYEAMTDVTARLAPKQRFLPFLRAESDVMYDLLRRIYIGMEGLWMHIGSLSVGNATSKLIASLVILGKRFGKQEQDGTTIELRMSEQDIADYAGMTRETTSRELQKLKKEGLVAFENSHLIIQIYILT